MKHVFAYQTSSVLQIDEHKNEIMFVRVKGFDKHIKYKQTRVLFYSMLYMFAFVLTSML